MQKTALIVGGGIGTRIKTKIPKQFLLANNLPILMHTINKFSHLDKIILVIPKNHFEYWNSLCVKYKFLAKHKLVEGGDSRFQSVKNGLKHIDKNDVVLIHDGVRPMISKNLINSNSLQELSFVDIKMTQKSWYKLGAALGEASSLLSLSFTACNLN